MIPMWRYEGDIADVAFPPRGSRIRIGPPGAEARFVGDPKGVYSANITTSGLPEMYTGAAADTPARAKNGDSHAPGPDRHRPTRSRLRLHPDSVAGRPNRRTADPSPAATTAAPPDHGVSPV
ncbi:MAG: hypothetical protein M3Y35_01170 [Actinomycetota bacterium]|nr:hypothetical protein [Actinomycetota bacterium]